ncbi:alcohol dehydrogenase catalytic domain-containing protein [uncultured Paludibaculum sp.]|uniref:MDR/zinc-dependent alcohol dehydrogenase-like family protein n=1 Tax=uncultured Paludibaculum sp. TaxID=1765020 RepID=UPI002AAA8877|nr:alcohol dehydrogenase catalytic domain-containing protein [uncultured Paludibaculum sp.]
MIGVHLEARTVTVRKMAKPRRPKGSALIRLICGGICNTDIELLRGYYGFKGTPGHEFVGEVVESDDARWVGRRVVGEINLPCGHCEWCARGLGRHCPTRTVLGIVRHAGAFREYLTLPEGNLRAVPAKVKTEHAVFTEPIAAACEILDQVRMPRGATVAVLGDGKLGLLVGQVLRCSGLEVHQYGRHRDKLQVAEAAGIDARLSNKLPAAAYDYVVEATGSSEGLMQAVRMTRPRGTIVMKSTVHGAVALDAAPVIVNEITLVGSRCGRFEPALKLLQSNKLQLDRMISDEFPLAESPRAFARAQERGVLKVLLRGS